MNKKCFFFSKLKKKPAAQIDGQHGNLHILLLYHCFFLNSNWSLRKGHLCQMFTPLVAPSQVFFPGLLLIFGGNLNWESKFLQFFFLQKSPALQLVFQSCDQVDDCPRLHTHAYTLAKLGK